MSSLRRSKALFAITLVIVWPNNQTAASEFTVKLGDRQTVIKEGAFGFRYFPDEPISVISRSPFRFLVVVGGKTVLMEGRTFETARPLNTSLEPSLRAGSFDESYAGISSVIRAPQRGPLLGFFHAEKPVGGTNREGTTRFYASIALAVSVDDGATFEKIGPVLTGRPEDPAWKGTAQGNADVSVCIDHTGKWLYAYYTEHSRRNPASGKSRSVITCMARSRIEDRGRPGTWRKYFNGSFDEPGLGGKDTEVANCWAPHVTYVPELKKYLMVGSRGGVHLLVSDDGIAWRHDSIVFIMDDVPLLGHEIAIHPSLHIEKAEAGRAEGYLFYAYSPNYGHEAPASSHFFVKQAITLVVSGKGGGVKSLLADRLKGTKWIQDGQPNNVFEWTNDGRLLQNGGNRKWTVLDDQSVEIRVPGKGGERIDRWVFAEDLKTVVQHGDGGKWKSTWRQQGK